MRLLILVIFAALLSTGHAGAEEKPIALKPKGQVVLREEKHPFGKDCHDYRQWPEFSGLESPAAEKRVNARARKIQTVGKKSPDTAMCCDGAANAAEIGGQRGDYLGVKFVIHFGGGGPMACGQARSIVLCRIFDLRSGGEVFLFDFVKSDAWEYATKIFEERAAHGSVEASMNMRDFRGNKTRDVNRYGSSFCLESDGLMLTGYGNFGEAYRAPIRAEDKQKLFKSSPVIDALVR